MSYRFHRVSNPYRRYRRDPVTLWHAGMKRLTKCTPQFSNQIADLLQAFPTRLYGYSAIELHRAVNQSDTFIVHYRYRASILSKSTTTTMVTQMTRVGVGVTAFRSQLRKIGTSSRHAPYLPRNIDHPNVYRSQKKSV